MISEFPLFMFTTLGGLAAGAYAASAVFPVGKDSKKVWQFPLVCLILLAVGLVFLPAHLGRPERLLAALTHPGAMIAQEAYWSIALGVILVIDIALSKMKGAAPRALRIVGAIVGIVLMAVMANAYFVSAYVVAWASWQVFPLYILGDLAMGAALLAVFNGELPKQGGYAMATGVLGVLAAAACALEAAHFAGVGADMVLMIVGAVVVLVGAIVAFAAKTGKLSGAVAAWVPVSCMFIGVALARYCFYAACVL